MTTSRNTRELKKGDVYMVNLGSFTSTYAPRGKRPCIIVQSNKNINRVQTVMAIPLTSNLNKPIHNLRTKIMFYDHLKKHTTNSMALCDSPVQVDKQNLKEYVGMVDNQNMKYVEQALKNLFWEN